MIPALAATLACTDGGPGPGPGSGDTDTADTDTGTGVPTLPGIPAEVPAPVPEDQIAGIVTVEWSDQTHLLPNWEELQFDALFWAERDFGNMAHRNVLIPYDGLDSCTAYTVDPPDHGDLAVGDPGVLTVTLDQEVLFHGPPNEVYDPDDAVVGYAFERPEPAFGAVVGVSAQGTEAVPGFDLPLVGWIPDGPPGDFTPEQSSIVPLDGLTFTWDNPLGGEIKLQLSLAWINYDCVLEDDGEWAVPADHLALVDQTTGPAANASLYKGTAQYIPIADDKYVLFHVKTQRSWGFGFER